MKISKEIEVDYGHTLPNHYSFCNQLHGHRATVIVTVEGNIVKKYGDSSQGMVFDFKILKEVMNEFIHNVIDHGFVVWKDDSKDLDFIKKRNKKYIITDEPPTAEILAEWAFFQIKDKLPVSVQLVSVDWYETPTSKATYSIGDEK